MGHKTAHSLLDRETEDLGRRYRALLAAVQAPGPTTSDTVWDELAETQKAIDTALARQQKHREETERLAQKTEDGALGNFLGSADNRPQSHHSPTSPAHPYWHLPTA